MTSEPPKRRRFLWLRIVFFLLSLPFVAWAVAIYSDKLPSYAQSFSRLSGFWWWFWALVLAWITWGIWRLLQRKWARAKALADEARARRRPWRS